MTRCASLNRSVAAESDRGPTIRFPRDMPRAQDVDFATMLDRLRNFSRLAGRSLRGVVAALIVTTALLGHAWAWSDLLPVPFGVTPAAVQTDTGVDPSGPMQSPTGDPCALIGHAACHSACTMLPVDLVPGGIRISLTSTSGFEPAEHDPPVSSSFIGVFRPPRA